MLLVLTGAALAIASPVVAQAGTAQPQAAQGQGEAVDSDANEVICQTFRQTGSRLGRKKLCMTSAQWARFREEQDRRARRDIGNGICIDSACGGV